MSYFNILKYTITEIVKDKVIEVGKIVEKQRVKIRMTPFEICNTIILLVVSLIFFGGVMWMGGTLVGSGGVSANTYYGKYKPMIIISGSMRPTIETNGLLLVGDVPFEELKEQDIILFNTSEYGLVIHRIIEKTEEGFKTKGDHNKSVDSWVVTPTMYSGKVIEIHNEVAPIITFLFGSLDEINITHVFFGYLIIAFVLIFVLSCIVNLYMFITIYFFICSSNRKGTQNVLEEYYPCISKRVQENEILTVITKLGAEKGLKKWFVTRYRMMQLHYVLKAEEKIGKKMYNLCEKIKGE